MNVFILSIPSEKIKKESDVRKVSRQAACKDQTLALVELVDIPASDRVMLEHTE